MDMLGWTLLSRLNLVLIVGVNPQTATILFLAITFLPCFNTPISITSQWLSCLIQRPESHSIHRYNYADLPLFDILFSTFRNPEHSEAETDFYTGAPNGIMDILLFKDIN